MIADWWVAGACLLAAGLCVYGLWRVAKWAERDFDAHVDMATALVNPPDADARRRHPANRPRSAASDPVCRRCGGTVIGPAVEHLCLGRVA